MSSASYTVFRPRGRRLAPWLAALVAAAFLAGVTVAAYARADVPAGTTVTGLEVGGLCETEARVAVAAHAQRAAQLLDGTILRAGETFSLNDALGERTLEHGFVSAPTIAGGGRLTDSVGRGISQVATALYNAAFFAGLELVAHMPHSLYISR